MRDNQMARLERSRESPGHLRRTVAPTARLRLALGSVGRFAHDEIDAASMHEGGVRILRISA